MKRCFVLATLLLLSTFIAMPAYATKSRAKVISGEPISFEIKEDGSLWEYGSVWRGGEAIEIIPPRLVFEDVNDAAAGSGHYLAVQSDGTLWGWGSNDGQLGNGQRGDRKTFEERIQIMSDVRKCYANRDASMAIKTDGSLWGWGRILLDADDLTDIKSENGANTHTKPRKLMTRVASVAIGVYHYFALRDDGTLWAWGLNLHGQLGTGNTKDITSPKRIMKDVAMVASGMNHGLALKKDGTLWAWGYNKSWQLGFDSGDVSEFTKPIQVMENVKFIAANDSYSMAIKEDGTLWTWGDNRDGQLGIGEVDYVVPEDFVETGSLLVYRYYMRSLPQQIMSGVKYCSVGPLLSSMLILKEDGSVWTTGNFSYSEVEEGTDFTVPRRLH